MKFKILKLLQKKNIIYIIAIIASIRLLIPLISKYIVLLNKCFNENFEALEVNNLLECAKAIIDNKIIGISYMVILVIISLLIYNIKFTKKQLKVEKEGINFKQKDETHGSANFINPHNIELLKIGKEEETHGIILGKTIDTNEIIILPDESKTINRNFMIWGASGSGKSTGYIIPNALKIAEQETIGAKNQKKNAKDFALQGKNVVFTDPKGELYSLTSEYFREQGYEIKVFNLVNPSHSDGIDLINFIDKEIDAQVFAQIVINTTQNAGKKGEEFWQNTQENLLKALLLHVRFEVEDKSKQNMRYLNSILASGDIKKIDEVFKNSTGITKIAYNIYAQASDTIKQSTIVGLATKLQIFQLDDVASITERNDIDFVDLNNKKMVIYCIISDMDTTMSFLNSLFFSFLFLKTIRQADKNETKKLNRPLHIFLDEFANIGQIPDFQQKLSTIRSREISCSIVCQHIAGLKTLYPNDVWQGLIGNCDVKIIMGTNDLLTAEYIRDMLGISTIETSSIRKEAEFDGKLDYGAISIATGKRNLMNSDEILRMNNDEEIVIIRGCKPFKCKKIRYWEYRLGKNLKEKSIEDYEPKNKYKLVPISEEKNIEEKKLPTFEEFLRERRKSN